MAHWLQRLLAKIPSSSAPLALANISAFGIQGLFAILLLGLFSPGQVAVYFVISQIAFFWNALALAQSTTTLLANRHTDLHLATRQAFGKSVLRMLLMLPGAGIAIWLSKLQPSLTYLAWALAIALSQMTWYLAQAYLLRAGTARQSAMARVLPPLIAAVLASIGALLQWQGPVLLLAALAGFAVGAIWLKGAFTPHPATQTSPSTPPRPSTQKDDRSTLLRLSQTLIDGLFFTGLAIVWQNAYGPEHAGWLLTLMRLMGFIPSLVHTAWQQVVLANPEQKQMSGLWVAMASSGIVVCLGLLIDGLVHWSILPTRWHGLSDYWLPMVIWHVGGCWAATFGHLSFAKGLAIKFSKLGITTQLIGIAILATPWLGLPLGPVVHIHLLAIANTVMTLILCALMLKAQPAA
ncbi:hypothetical protein [Limnohabitans sp. DM1]|uniref:hypothetical protein n=1 Tax=Limnohabitans sp. DM1 TaxID=1597955 RepID=UPI000ACB2A1B|nr:hypothetical protein [Limnohabitans sp. DM1]